LKFNLKSIMGCGRSREVVEADWDNDEENDDDFDKEINIKGFAAEIVRRNKNKSKKHTVKSVVKIPKGYEDMFFKVDMGDGDEFMSILPWEGAIKAPKPLPVINKSAPEDNYMLQVAYGVRTEE
jgi:hypothetical protein